MNRLTRHFCYMTVMAAGLATGCDQKEDVLEIETPGAEVDVERDTETGEVEIDVDEK